MPISQFVKWKQKTVLGASLEVTTPTGQYDPTKLVNFSPQYFSSKCVRLKTLPASAPDLKLITRSKPGS
jgi:hypothetical protein